MDRLNQFTGNLRALGSRKLLALALIIVLVMSIVSVSAYYLSRPNFETLYAGLDREDIGRIGAALRASGIPFDVNPEGNTVSVPFGQTAQARMMLAERGLPQSANAGYELFDKVGALGLTSFMQEVTRVRALEGELARTIQLIRGVKAARVHIVMPDEGSFRRAKQQPSASVIIRTEGPDDTPAAQAIRHLVASSLPGMTVDQVTVLNTDGSILSASDGEPADTAPVKTLTLEKNIAHDIQDNIRRTLTPYLRLANFQVSVRARVNTDRKQMNETIFDPDSKVERSVRTVKENSQSQNNGSGANTTVERNIPQAGQSSNDGRQSSDQNRKSEELTNFELSSKTISTVSGGYNIDNISVAVLVNRNAFAEPGKPPPKGEEVDRQVREIEALVMSAAGLKKERGDMLKVTAVDFLFNDNDIGPAEGPGFVSILQSHFGVILNALTAVGVAALVVVFGLMPARRALLAEPAVERLEPPPLIAAEGVLPGGSANLLNGQGADSAGSFVVTAGEIAEPKRDSALRKLEQLIKSDDARAATVMKQWLRT